MNDTGAATATVPPSTTAGDCRARRRGGPGECWNCGQKGHKRDTYPLLKKVAKTEGKDPDKKPESKGTGNASSGISQQKSSSSKNGSRTANIAPIDEVAGDEYLSNKFTEYLDSHGTECETSVHDAPQENGVAERLNRTLMERVGAMITAQEPAPHTVPEAPPTEDDNLPAIPGPPRCSRERKPSQYVEDVTLGDFTIWSTRRVPIGLQMPGQLKPVWQRPATQTT